MNGVLDIRVVHHYWCLIVHQKTARMDVSLSNSATSPATNPTHISLSRLPCVSPRGRLLYTIAMQVLLLRRRNREAPGLFIQDAAREAGSRPEGHLHRADVSRRLSLPPIDEGHPTASRQLHPRYVFTRQRSLCPTTLTKLFAASTAVGLHGSRSFPKCSPFY